jgi:DNA-binding XRE family transcriptional regulator
MNPTLLSSGPAVYPDWDDAVADLGDRVRAERKARGWTQQQLAERCGLNAHQIKHVEAGATSIRNYLAACWGLGVELADLLSDRWRMPEPRARLTPMQARVVREAVSGDRLPVIAARIGTTRQVVGARLSEAYRLLGVSHLPVRERRAAAVRVAMKQGLIGEALASRTA